jgi:hypothetical protein
MCRPRRCRYDPRMIWAQWTIVSAAVLGFVVLLLLALGLWRRLKAFAAMLGRASETLAGATAALESAQSAGSARSARERNFPGVH